MEILRSSSSFLQDAPQEQLKVPLRALPSDQVVRLVFPTSQVLVTQRKKARCTGGAGPRPQALKGWPASVAASVLGPGPGQMPGQALGEEFSEHPCLQASGLAPVEMAGAQGSMGLSWDVAWAGLTATGCPIFVTGGFMVFRSP